MPSSQMNNNLAGRRASTRGTVDYSVSEQENVDFIQPNMWPQTALILIQWIMLFVVPYSNESVTDENLTRWKN